MAIPWLVVLHAAPDHPSGMRLRGCALLAGALMAGAVSAQNNGELLNLINSYRSSAQTCAGRQAVPAGPLAPDAALARMLMPPGVKLHDALKDAGYQAASAQAITVSGPANPAAAMRFIRQRYCRLVLNPGYSEIGISREADTWRIVFARPLLSAGLGGWAEAGKQILKDTNEARAAARNCGNQKFQAVPPLEWNGKLSTAALAHSREMAGRNYFSHAGKGGGQVSDRATEAGYNWRRIGENIAAGQSSPKQVVSAWLASPGHCANIMNPEFTEMGAAYAVNPESDTTIYWTQVFGTSP